MPWYLSEGYRPFMKLYNLLRFMGGVSVVSDCSAVALGDVDNWRTRSFIRHQIQDQCLATSLTMDEYTTCSEVLH